MPMINIVKEHPEEYEESMLGEKTTFDLIPNDRGLRVFKFKDTYDSECTIQDSSSASQCAIWFGISEPKIQIMASDARELGMFIPPGTTAWVDINIPDQAIISSRMHLSQAMAIQLLPYLEYFALNGHMPEGVFPGSLNEPK